jgi:hypothetical protein
MRVKNAVEPMKTKPGMDRAGSRPKPPKAGAQRASLEATRSMPDHEKAKRRLTDKTVAFAQSSRPPLARPYAMLSNRRLDRS